MYKPYCSHTWLKYHYHKFRFFSVRSDRGKRCFLCFRAPYAYNPLHNIPQKYKEAFHKSQFRWDTLEATSCTQFLLTSQCRFTCSGTSTPAQGPPSQQRDIEAAAPRAYLSLALVQVSLSSQTLGWAGATRGTSSSHCCFSCRQTLDEAALPLEIHYPKKASFQCPPWVFSYQYLQWQTAKLHSVIPPSTSSSNTPRFHQQCRRLSYNTTISYLDLNILS